LASEWGPGVLLTLGTLWVLQGVIAKTSSHGVIVHGINYNAGMVKSGTVISHDVRVINLSAQSVQVDAQPGCGCTLVKSPTAPIRPLQSQNLETQVNTVGMKLGEQERATMVHLRLGSRTWQQISVTHFVLN